MAYALFTSCLFGAFLVLHLMKKKGRHLTIICILIGFGIAPLVGSWLGAGFAALGGVAFGLVVPAALSVFVVLWLFFDIKERRDHKWTRWIALAAAAIITAGAQSGLPILNSITKTGNSVMEQGNVTIGQAGK